MSDIKLPQNDDHQKRAAELAGAGSIYKYNHDIGLPLIDAEGPEDKNQPDWTLKIFTKLLSIRTNVQAIYDKSGLKFQQPKPVRDIPKLIEVLKNDGSVNDYFAPDLGFVAGPDNRAKAVSDYVDKIFVDRDKDNKGTAPLPEMAMVWDSDKTFAYNFLAGPNPNQLERYRLETKPADFDITSLDLGSLPEFGGDSIARAIGEGRVYLVDRSDLKALYANLPNAPAPNAAPRVFKAEISSEWKYIYAPYVAFALPPGGKHILPIAIQCGATAVGHQIYTPRDG